MVVVVVEEEDSVFPPQREESALEDEERSRKKCYSIACSSYYGPSRATPEIIYTPSASFPSELYLAFRHINSSYAATLDSDRG